MPFVIIIEEYKKNMIRFGTSQFDVCVSIQEVKNRKVMFNLFKQKISKNNFSDFFFILSCLR